LHRRTRPFLAGGFQELLPRNGELHLGQRTLSAVEELRELALLAAEFRGIFPLSTGLRNEAAPILNVPEWRFACCCKEAGTIRLAKSKYILEKYVTEQQEARASKANLL
jgi:hypothetical protein